MVHVYQWNAICFDIIAQYFFSFGCMCMCKRWCGNVDHNLGPLFHQFIHRIDGIKRVFIANIPQIFTNAQCYFFPFKFYHMKFMSGFEISIFVKDIIGGQQSFSYNLTNFTFLKQPSGIVKILAFGNGISLGSPYDHAYSFFSTIFCQFFDDPIRALNKIIKFQKITRRISRHGQLRKYQQIGLLFKRTINCFFHLFKIALEISDMKIQLGQCKLH